MTQDLSNRSLPCDKPQVPRMKLLDERIESFCSWPHHLVRPSKQHMAMAGFFYEGNQDNTRCFYCNGQLREWESDDDPWTEHAKWFPGCEYVLRHKGLRFVRAVTEAHPKLNRPSIPNSVAYLWLPTLNPRLQRNPENNFRTTSTGRQGFHRLVPRQAGRTECDALPTIHTTTSDAEQAPGSYVYMPDVTNETNRLASFMKCPQPMSATSKRFAEKHGFHYTGREDIASCFSCGCTWSITRTAYSSSIHVSDCRMKKQPSTESNVPQQPVATSGVDPGPSAPTEMKKRSSSSESPRNYPQTP